MFKRFDAIALSDLLSASMISFLQEIDIMQSNEDVRCIKLSLLQYDPRVENLQAVAIEPSTISSQGML